MPNRDFFDEDLIKPRAENTQIRLGPGGEPPPAAYDPEAEGGSRGAGDIELPMIVRHKKQVEEEAARRAQEIERLRQMQENLEREKRDLEELRRKQSEYERGKQEILERLQQSLVALERHELRTAQLADLLQNARRRFKEIEGQIRAIREDEWPEDGVREELTKALALLEDSRMEYNRAMARIEALLGDQSKNPAAPVVVFDEGASRGEQEKSFLQWMGIGLAVSLPLILALLALAVFLALYGSGRLF